VSYLKATTAEIQKAIRYHAERIDMLVAQPHMASSVSHHMEEIKALNRLLLVSDEIRVEASDARG
jgi:hypothetical protein